MRGKISDYSCDKFKDFLKLHYEKTILTIEEGIYRIKIVLFAGKESRFQVIFESSDFKELIEFFEKKLFYHPAFLSYSSIGLMEYYLQVQYDFKIEKIVKTGWIKSKYEYKIVDEMGKQVFTLPFSYEELTYIMNTNYKYSLEKLLPYICPNCDNLLVINKVDNALLFSCNHCDYKTIEIL